MKILRLISLPLATLATTAMLTGCGSTASPTAPGGALDTTPPPAPASVMTSWHASGTARIIWDPSAAPDVAGYQVYVYSPSPDRDNAYILADDPNSIDTSFSVPTVHGDAQSVYRVRAVDVSGNHSAFSASVVVQFQAASGGGGMEPTLVDPN